MITDPIRRRQALAVAFTVASLLSGCKDSVLDMRNAQIVNGKVFEADANEPFSGTLTNLPASQLFNQQPGFQQVANAISNTGALIPASVRALQSFGGLSNASVLLPTALCAVSIKNGAPDGKATCTAPRSDVVRITAAFTGAVLSGDFRLYDETGKNPLAKVSFNDGRYVEGKIEGDVLRYAPDGKQVVYRGSFVNGLQEGSEKTFDAQTGKLTGQAEYLHGKLEGTVKRWTIDGTIAYEKDYQNGQEISATGTVRACIDGHRVAAHGVDITFNLINQWEAQCKEAQSSGGSPTTNTSPEQVQAESNDSGTDECVSTWTAAFHREKGEDAAVAPDQIDEWRSWCAQGKHP
jgi:hypothetical protein